MAHDLDEFARLVFGIFQKHHREVTSPTAQWWLTFCSDDDDDGSQSGLTKEQVGAGVRYLLQKQLIRNVGMQDYSLTSDGEEACLHPELLDDYLAPRRVAPTLQNVTFNVDQMHNTQVGDGNQLTVTYQTVLSSLAGAIESTTDVPDEQKRTWLATLKQIAAHPLTQTVLGAVGGAAGAYAGK